MNWRKFHLLRSFALFATIACVGLCAHTSAVARPQTAYNIQSGTGFFITAQGYIITNAHVVQGCKDVTVRGEIKPTDGTVVARDNELDLAIIKVDRFPRIIAPLRNYAKSIRKGDKVLLIGYPLEHGVSGEYKVVESEVMDTVGPDGNPKWISFQDSAQQGNSGGPLLDSSGNVIGVITAKTTMYRIDPRTNKQVAIKNADVAVSLSTLKDFLRKNRIYYRDIPSAMHLANHHIERNAKYYIVNVHCKLSD